MEGYDFGEHLAHLALMLDQKGTSSLPWLLGSIALDQVKRGAATAGAEAAILGFWNTIGRLVAPMAFVANIAVDHANQRNRREQAAIWDAAVRLQPP